MENTFFTYLTKNGLIDTWAPALGWYLSSEHFASEKWKNYISVFTKKVKKIRYIKDIEIKYGLKEKLTFPSGRPKGTRIVIARTNKDSVGKDFVRHIRNGIAHGRAKFIKIGQIKFVEIKDHKDNQKTQQTAYILIPRDCLIEIYDIYLGLRKKVKKLEGIDD